MDSILNFVKNLDAIQWLLIAGGVVLLWPSIKTYGAKLIPKRKSGGDLTDLVSKWESLYDACHQEGLHDACVKLREVFPMLIKADDTEHDTEEKTS